ncbi:MAG TPA: hypothetical protein VGA64_11850 [Candidatus Polarisedimenticolia bacterium]
MNRISKRLALPLISTCLTLACNHSNDLESRFAGDWMFNALVLEDGCSSYPGVGPLTGHIRIIQTGDSLVLEQQGCCLAGTIGTGTADRIAFTATSIRTVPAGPNCSYQLNEVDNGIVRGDQLSADATVQVTRTDGCFVTGMKSSDVMLAIPCQIQGKISATRCGSEGCGIVCVANDPLCPL